MVLDELHKRDRRAREKAIAEYAREASKRAAGSLHRLTKPRAIWCPRDAAQGEAANPRGAAELAAKSWSRIWREHVEELQTADRPWEETPNGEDMSVLPQLEVDGPSGFDAVVGSFKTKTGIRVDAIHPSMWSRISEQGKQLYTDLLNDVGTHFDLACADADPDQLSGSQDAAWWAAHRTHAIHRACVGTYAQAHSGSMDDFPVPALWLGVQRPFGRSGGVAGTWYWKKGRTTNQAWAGPRRHWT